MADVLKPNPESLKPDAHDGGEELVLPSGWMYKQFKIGSFQLPWYASPPAQLLLVAVVCFMCPGMFNALNGMGGAGQLDATANDLANTALYSTFAVVGFFSGTFANVLGLRLTLGLGGLGYCVYVASFLSYSHTRNLGFTIFAGALLGVCAGLLWTAQGAIMMSYPPEGSKGRYISWFWMIFNLGAVIGSLVLFGENYHVDTNETVSDGTYVGFLVLTGIGALLAVTLVSSKSIIRSDGSRVILMKNPSWKSEIWGLVAVFRTDAYIVFFFPMFFASNFFYTYHFNCVNGSNFNARTKALNDILYWIMQIIGSFIFGYALDHKAAKRSTRARIAWIALFTITMVIWGGGYQFQKGFTRADASDKTRVRLDWTHNGYVGPLFLYMFYGFYDAAFQTCVYWYMGALTNNSRKLANFTGFYKGIQSAGGALAWALDDHKVSFMALFAGSWTLLAGSLIVALPLVLRISDSVSLEDDIKFSDGTIQEVAPTAGRGEVEIIQMKGGQGKA